MEMLALHSGLFDIFYSHKLSQSLRCLETVDFWGLSWLISSACNTLFVGSILNRQHRRY